MNMKPLIDSQEFLALSSFLNYQLAGEPINWRGVLGLIIKESLPPRDEELLMDTMAYLEDAYGQEKRRLGPLAILHPIRAAAILVRSQEQPAILEILTTLLHDRHEDIRQEYYAPETWARLEDRYRRLIQRIDANANWFLHERLHYLTKVPGQKYHEYLGNLFSKAKQTPELAAIKLADRLDNTLDLRVDLHEFTDSVHCFQVIFDILFINVYKGFRLEQAHPAARKINGAMRLYQLYKNTVLLTLLRSAGLVLPAYGEKLLYSLAVASIREAQTILLHIFAYHLPDPHDQRALLLEVMTYAHQDGFSRISESGTHRLDGLFRGRFTFDSKEAKKQGLETLYQDKWLMGLSAAAFMVLFSSFINDPHFRIKGIEPTGIFPV